MPRDIERKEMGFFHFMGLTIGIMIFISMMAMGLYEINRGDEFKPCNEHEGVNCEGK